MFKLVLEKAEEPEVKLPTSAGSSKNQEGRIYLPNFLISAKEGSSLARPWLDFPDVTIIK